MSSEDELAKRMANAGVDVEFYKQLNKLEEIKELVKQGKVKEKVYKELEEAVFKAKAKKENADSVPGNSGSFASPGPSQNRAAAFFGGLKTVLKFPTQASKRKTNMNPNGQQDFEFGNNGNTSGNGNINSVRSRGVTLASGYGGRNRGESVQSNTPGSGNRSGLLLKTRSMAPGGAGSTDGNNTGVKEKTWSTSKLIDGELMKYIRYHGRKQWRKMYVVLYQDRIEFFTKATNKKASKILVFDSEYYVSEYSNKQLQAKITKNNVKSSSHDRMLSGDKDDLESDTASLMSPGMLSDEGNDFEFAAADEAVINMPHVFVISTISQKIKIYLAAESAEKKQFWLTMMVEVLREFKSTNHDSENININQRPSIASQPQGMREKFWDKYNTMKNAFFEGKVGDSINAGELDAMDGEAYADRVNTWQMAGDKVARISVVDQWKSREMNGVRQVLKERDNLKRELQIRNEQFKHLISKKDEEIAVIKEDFKKEVDAVKEENKQWHEKYNDLMQKYRDEAHMKREETRAEEARLRNELKSLKRLSVMPRGKAGRDYETEIEMLMKKVETLQKALKVDLSDLDWDGSLEQAEEKMKDCFRQIMEGATPAIQQKAQQDFDKWDQLVRNHEDYIKRETNKWKDWEQENEPKNLEALQEMRTNYVPEVFRDGCSEQQIMDLTGCTKKAAARVFKNKIFKFLWMDKERIARIHVADLLNNYASQGLDLRELRAVYSTLPDDFQNDNDGGKKRFREGLRSRLFELTEKEKNGTISSTELLNNAYRDKEVREKPTAIGGGDIPKPLTRVKRAPNNKFAGKAAALEAFFNQQQGGSAAPKPAATNNANNAAPKKANTAPVTKSNEIDADAPEWQKYFKMQKMSLPDGAIRQKLQQDGLDPSMWDKLKAAKESGGASSSTSNDIAPSSSAPAPASNNAPAIGFNRPPAEEKLNPNDEQWNTYFKMQKLGLADGAIKSKFVKDGRDPSLWDELLKLKSLQPAAKANTMVQLAVPGSNTIDPIANLAKTAPGQPVPVEEDADESNTNNNNPTEMEKSHRKKTKKPKTQGTRRPKKEKSQRGTNLMHGHTNNPSDLLRRAQIDVEIDAMAGGAGGASKAMGGIMNYNANVRKKKSGTALGPATTKKKSLRKGGARNHDLVTLDDTVDDVIEIIMTKGEFDENEGGLKTLSFGELYSNFMSSSDLLVGLLLKGKQTGALKYKGDMLFKGIHDQVKITVLDAI